MKIPDSFIFLDETELGVHPKWQKEYLSNILASIKPLNTKGKKINIFFATHSPFILSDLPKENVIFLEQGKQVDVDINPFGANIHTLLSHGFFMKDGLMGEFAKGKINQIKKFYDDVIKYKDNKDELVASRCIYDDKKDAKNKDALVFQALDNLRNFAIWAFKTSEQIGENVLAYDPVPGSQKGCISLNEATEGKAWSL